MNYPDRSGCKHLLSYGGGVNSTALILLMEDACEFVDIFDQLHMSSYRSRCEDCICLVEGDNGVWVCDELQKKVEEVKDCPEGLELKEAASTPLKGGISCPR